MNFKKIGDFAINLSQTDDARHEVGYEYTGNPENSFISKFHVMQWNSDAIILRIETSTFEKWDQIAQSLSAAGFPLPKDYERRNKSVKFESGDLQLLSNYMQILTRVEKQFTEVADELRSVFNLDFSQFHHMSRWFKRKIPIISWDSGYKYTNYTYEYEYGGKPDASIISFFSIKENLYGEFRIRVTASTIEKYDQLIKSLSAAGFPMPEPEWCESKDMYFKTDESHFISNFIQILARDENQFAEIVEEIGMNHKLDLSRIHKMPMWFRFGNLEDLVDIRFGIEHTVTYTHAKKPESTVISKFILVGHENSDFELGAKASTDEKYLVLRNALVAAGFSKTQEKYNIADRCMTIRTRNWELISNFILELIRIESAFIEVANELRGYISLDLSQIHQINLLDNSSKIVPQRFFSTSSSSQSTAQIDNGINAKKLKEINFTGEIPSEFKCHLTNEIMTVPVYDLKHPNVKYERAAIFKSFPNTSTIGHGLILDVGLQTEIDSFMKNNLAEMKVQSGMQKK